jgi:hypothetical protein
LSVRIMAMSCIKEMNDTYIFGQKQKREYRGKKKIYEMVDQILKVHHQISELEQRLGTEVFEGRKKKLGENLKKTFSAVQVQQQKKAFEKAFDVQHVKSAKERQAGFDVAPILEGKLQLGKLHGRNTNNAALLTAALFARLENDLGRQLGDPEDQAEQLTKLIPRGRTRDEIDFPIKEQASVKKMGIKAVKDALKYHEEIRCDLISAKYDFRYFEVLYTAIDEYSYKLV